MDNFILFLKQPWPWYIAGPLIGLIVPVLLLIGNKAFGISSSLRHICAACVPLNISYFKYEWKREIWNLYFVAGIILGSAFTVIFFDNPEQILLSESLKLELLSYGIDNYTYALVPIQLVNWDSLFTLKGFLLIIGGGFAIGFGTRYAGGCTSGHSIFGLATLSWVSLVATICFMIGGFIGANFLIPFILTL